MIAFIEKVFYEQEVSNLDAFHTNQQIDSFSQILVVECH